MTIGDPDDDDDLPKLEDVEIEEEEVEELEPDEEQAGAKPRDGEPLTDAERLKVSRRAEKQAKRETERLAKELEVLRSQVGMLTESEIARAVEKADADVLAAEKLLDDAEDDGDRDKAREARRLLSEREKRRDQIKSQVESFKAKPAAAPKQNLAAAWIDDNPWFDPAGQDERSLRVRQLSQELIDDGVAGDNPAHFRLLTKRVQELGLDKSRPPRTGSRPTAGGGNRGARADAGGDSGEKQAAWRTLCQNAKSIGTNLKDAAELRTLRAEFEANWKERRA